MSTTQPSVPKVDIFARALSLLQSTDPQSETELDKVLEMVLTKKDPTKSGIVEKRKSTEAANPSPSSKRFGSSSERKMKTR